MLTVTDADAVLFALSLAVPLITWPAPSVETVAGTGQNATPPTPAEQVKVTVTFELFQWAELAGGVATPKITSGPPV